jgi:hypothetical protein
MQRMAVLGRAAGKQFSNRQPFKSRKHQLSLEKRTPPAVSKANDQLYSRSRGGGTNGFDV